MFKLISKALRYLFIGNIALMVFVKTPLAVASCYNQKLMQAFYETGANPESTFEVDLFQYAAMNDPLTYLADVSNIPLAIFGSGVQNRQTGEVLTIACTSATTELENCKCARFIYVNPKNKKAYSFGTNFGIQPGESIKQATDHEGMELVY